MLKPSVLPERRGLHQQAVQDHREGEAQHGEEDLAVAREQEAEHPGDQRRDRGAERHHDGQQVAGIRHAEELRPSPAA